MTGGGARAFIVGSIGGISSSMGVFGLSVLVVVIVGGLDSILGALVGGLLRRLGSKPWPEHDAGRRNTSSSPPSSCWSASCMIKPLRFVRHP
jgi:ABC-type branched-subunit amino acid transport system permease subunit